MKKLLLLAITTILCIACNRKKPSSPPASIDRALTSYVNTFVGTGGHGHTYPGATMPFGMMQLSPDTRLDGWDGCSGYHYSDEYIYGFSHTHLSGTGVSDYGDLLLMPTNQVNFNNGADGKKGYRAHFSHSNETASPGYYKVHLDSTNIDVELTVTERAGMHKYTFPSSKDQIIILDLEHRDKLLDYDIHQVSDTQISGYRYSQAWAAEQRLFFYLKFSKPVTIAAASNPAMGKSSSQVALQVENPLNEPVYISVGISGVDRNGALKNLDTEMGTKSFETIKKGAQEAWEDQLQKIVVNTANETSKVNFYSALYHTMIAPNLYQDVDGRYRGMDMEIHQTSKFNYYTVFSLWDTYRAAHPLYTIIEQDRTNDFVNTLLAKYDEGGIMPIWDLSANYTGCMIGYHGVPVIADAYLKGIDNFDPQKALKAMKHSAMQDHLGLEAYKATGFVPVEQESESVSKTLEYAYDDWTIAAMAKKMGNKDDYQLFSKRAQNYKNVYNTQTGFMQGRFNNTWFGPFDPYEVNFNYTEANAWQYSVYVPQDITGLTKLMGGKAKLEAHLDAIFSAKQETSGRDQADITGLIGQYAHGNEPSHHMAYLYNFVNKPAKTQKLVHQIVTELYANQPDGISGNEDCGQMSAWYVFSSLGFYPVTPGSNTYIIGTPSFDRASINLENGKTFTISTQGISEENIYIENAFLNGKPLQRSYLFHEEIISGGNLHFNMTHRPSNWATQDKHIPVTSITENLIVTSPYIKKGEIAFKDYTSIALDDTNEDAVIYYSLNDAHFKPYKTSFNISEKSILKIYSEKDGEKSSVLRTEFFKIDPNLHITLESKYANEYNAGGNHALIDGIKGTRDFRTGAWQGYQDSDVLATIDLGSSRKLDEISTHFLQDQRSWIFLPTEVEILVSKDGKNYTSLGIQTMNASDPSEEIEIKNVDFTPPNLEIRYLKLKAKNLGAVPQWHLGHPYNGKAWIFIDEIEIK